MGRKHLFTVMFTMSVVVYNTLNRLTLAWQKACVYLLIFALLLFSNTR